jgi:hypothetical protein
MNACGLDGGLLYQTVVSRVKQHMATEHPPRLGRYSTLFDRGSTKSKSGQNDHLW